MSTTSSSMAGKAVIVFLKAPEDGRVKTRLAENFSKGLVLDLYKAFVEDILVAVNLSGTPEIFYYPPKKKQMIVQWLGDGWRYTCQSGMDLGQRMANAFKMTFDKGYEKAVLIGSDIPELNAKILKQSFEQLRLHDLVLGPSKDGGYYLIGFNRESYSDRLFENIGWSTPRVFSQTLGQAVEIHLNTVLLPVLNDIDTLEDLKALVSSINRGGYIGDHTATLVGDWLKADVFKENQNE